MTVPNLPITTIILGPSGSGKSTRANAHKQGRCDFVHINRDTIASSLIREYQRQSGDNSRPKRKEVLGAVMALQEAIYESRILAEINKRNPHIIVDYPPGRRGIRWASETAIKSRSAGRVVVLEGISASPEATLPRVLRRNSRGMDLSIQLPDIMAPDRRSFERWLRSYKYFPSQFIELAAVSDAVILYDNNASAMRVIGEWTHECHIARDVPAIHNCLQLSNVNTDTARFEIDVITSKRSPKGELIHNFVTSMSEVYRSNEQCSGFHNCVYDMHPRYWNRNNFIQ